MSLLPCPFCGGEAETHEVAFPYHYWDVWCDGECFDHFCEKPTEAEAIAAWNTRHQCGLTDEDYSILLDELGVSERTCEFNIKDNMNETEGMGDVWIECSACHCKFDYYADEWLMNMHYCPYCGARVVE